MEDEWEGHIVQKGDKINAHINLDGKLKEKKLLGRSRRKWVNRIKTYLK
jgi:hypothetical protein